MLVAGAVLPDVIEQLGRHAPSAPPLSVELVPPEKLACLSGLQIAAVQSSSAAEYHEPKTLSTARALR